MPKMTSTPASMMASQTMSPPLRVRRVAPFVAACAFPSVLLI